MSPLILPLKALLTLSALQLDVLAVLLVLFDLLSASLNRFAAFTGDYVASTVILIVIDKVD